MRFGENGGVVSSYGRDKQQGDQDDRNRRIYIYTVGGFSFTRRNFNARLHNNDARSVRALYDYCTRTPLLCACVYEKIALNSRPVQLSNNGGTERVCRVDGGKR